MGNTGFRFQLLVCSPSSTPGLGVPRQSAAPLQKGITAPDPFAGAAGHGRLPYSKHHTPVARWVSFLLLNQLPEVGQVQSCLGTSPLTAKGL